MVKAFKTLWVLCHFSVSSALPVTTLSLPLWEVRGSGTVSAAGSHNDRPEERGRAMKNSSGLCMAGGGQRQDWWGGFNLPREERCHVPRSSAAVIKGTRPAEIGSDPAVEHRQPRLPALSSAYSKINYLHETAVRPSPQPLAPEVRKTFEIHYHIKQKVLYVLNSTRLFINCFSPSNLMTIWPLSASWCENQAARVDCIIYKETKRGRGHVNIQMWRLSSGLSVSYHFYAVQ